jgi:hypothetical protein
MLGTYKIKEAQANLTKLCRSGRKFVISNRNRPVVVALPVEDFEIKISASEQVSNWLCALPTPSKRRVIIALCA